MFTSLLPHNFFCFSGSHSSDCSHVTETIRQLLEENESLKNRNDELNHRIDELNQCVDALNHRVDELTQCNDALNRRNLELESTCRHYASATSSKKPKFPLNYSSQRNGIESFRVSRPGRKRQHVG